MPRGPISWSCSGSRPVVRGGAGKPGLRRFELRRVALSRAMVWAADGKQTPERLRKALEAYRQLPPMPSAAEPIRAEAQIIRNTENLPRAELVDRILEMKLQVSIPSDLWMHKLWVDVVTTPWELARTGRALRLVYASQIVEAGTDPWHANRTGWSKLALTTGSPGRILAPDALHEIEASTPLVQTFLAPIDSYLFSWDQNEVERRAFVQILALRVWQLGHDGRLPESLQELVTAGLFDDITHGSLLSGPSLRLCAILGPGAAAAWRTRPGTSGFRRIQETSADSQLLAALQRRYRPGG